MDSVNESIINNDFDRSHISNADVKDYQKSEKVNSILKLVQDNKGISCWDIEKILNIPHSSAYYILRDLQHAQSVFSKIKINSENRTVRLFFAAKSKNKVKVKNAKN